MAILRFYTTLVRHEYITGVTFKSMGKILWPWHSNEPSLTLSKRLHNYTILFLWIFQWFFFLGPTIISDRVRANTLFFFVVGYTILPLCLVRNLPVENSTDGVMTITNRTVQWVIFHAAPDTVCIYVNRFISVSSYFLSFPRNAIRGPAIHVFLVTEYDSNPFRRNKSTSRLRRSLGRCATSLGSLLTTYESSTCSKSTKKCKLCITHLQRTSQYHARFCKPSPNLQRLLL